VPHKTGSDCCCWNNQILTFHYATMPQKELKKISPWNEATAAAQEEARRKIAENTG